jgi:Flp pilus assembly protein TadG
MLRAIYLRCRGLLKRVIWQKICTACAGAEAAQIVELAITLPVLVGLWYGMFDFGQAFNIKQKLSDITREAARFSANQTTSDLTTAPPQSILAIRNLVSAALIANNISDCGLASKTPIQSPTYTWTFTATCGAGNLTLKINRGKILSAGSQTVEGTQVDLNYPHQWQFSRVVKLIAPNASFTGPAQIPATSIMANIN